MFSELSIESKYFYHNSLSFIMLIVWLVVFIKGYSLKDDKLKYQISNLIIIFCLSQELLESIHHIFLDSNVVFSVQRDLPFLQFCQIGFYFSLICIFLSRNYIPNKKYSYFQFLFDCSFILGFSGAFQGIITPDLLNIDNIIEVVCVQLQHSLIILNLIWLMTAYNYRLKFRGVCLTYLFINLIVPFALIFNSLLGPNSNGDYANYFYVNELPKIDNFFLNFVSQYSSPDYIFYIQPIIIIYFLMLYIPFGIWSKLKKN
tara:strand:+ start:437 stop:1213 length:777 start_codon:yes stop_codon:yes gene_type:complete